MAHAAAAAEEGSGPAEGTPGAPAADTARGPGAPAPDSADVADVRGPDDAPPASARAGSGSGPRTLPPGQHTPRVWPVMHYGPVPTFRPDRWDLRVCGATASGAEHRWDWAAVSSMPSAVVVADMHCVTKFTLLGVIWQGIPAEEVLCLAPPAPEVTHVMVWADFGYSANLPIADFADERTLFATHRDGAELPPEHGFPVRLVVPHRYAWKSVKWVRAIEYLTSDRRGFWEERGYHNNADPWREQRFSYQEAPGEGPPL